jgi:hypothetical protein
METKIDKNSSNKLPTFPDSLYTQLHQLLQDAVSSTTSNQEKDMLLLGAITSNSSCLPKICYKMSDVQKLLDANYKKAFNPRRRKSHSKTF